MIMVRFNMKMGNIMQTSKRNNLILHFKSSICTWTKGQGDKNCPCGAPKPRRKRRKIVIFDKHIICIIYLNFKKLNIKYHYLYYRS